MKTLQRLVPCVLFLVIVLMSCGPVFAGESATADECKAQVQKAVDLAAKMGIEKAIQTLNDPKGPFVWKDSYVFCLDLDKRLVIAHPTNPKLIGKDWAMSAKDVKGKMFFAEFVKVSQDPGEGWVEYWWPKPGETEASKKNAYVLKVPGMPYSMGAGAYTE
ncbi:MAG: cache domain-containing protein [Desulfatibacillum sp.]|nr:cache domain-containing protein [Desulfatibacillum sp.]